MNRSLRWLLVAGALVAFVVAVRFLRGPLATEPAVDTEAVVADVLSEASTARVRATCSACHVFPPPDMLPREYWVTAVRGMFQIAADRGVAMPVSLDRAMAWYVFQAPERLPPAPGRADAGPGSVAWAREEWRPEEAPPPSERGPAVTHVQMASLLGGAGLDVLVSDVSTNRVYALRRYASEGRTIVVGTVPHPGRLAVTDLDADGRKDVVVAALGQLKPTNDPVGSVVWLRRTGPTSFEGSVLADGLGRVADVQAADLDGDGRTDLLVAVFGWMENGGLLWLRGSGGSGATPAFTRQILDARPGFTDVRVGDLDGDGRLDVAALVAQEFQQVMVYWGSESGFRSQVVYQAPNPDWGYTGLEVTDFTGDGLPDLVVTNGDNLDLTVAKPYHGVAMLENLGDGAFGYRHLTSLYGAHRAVPVDLDGDGRTGLVVGAYLPPSVASRAPPPSEAVIWLERAGPTRLIRRVLKPGGAHHMTLAAGDATGDGRPDLALGLMDLGVVDPGQAHQGEPLSSHVSLWTNQGASEASAVAGEAAVIDWGRLTGLDSIR
jgi:hypothetical protein